MDNEALYPLCCKVWTNGVKHKLDVLEDGYMYETSCVVHIKVPMFGEIKAPVKAVVHSNILKCALQEVCKSGNVPLTYLFAGAINIEPDDVVLVSLNGENWDMCQSYEMLNLIRESAGKPIIDYFLNYAKGCRTLSKIIDAHVDV